ncbi:hypothetical protein HGRIS_000964 [Hohenbuehelia grisea]|uniref:BTB domain-containing protein n=1 Tax=Hohenbuehelia grisea TaxID=104357 RepID=A0ABR3IQB3_9AGAR
MPNVQRSIEESIESRPLDKPDDHAPIEQACIPSAQEPQTGTQLSQPAGAPDPQADSVTFTAKHLQGGGEPDLLIQSSDGALFHVHTWILNGASTNAFDGLASKAGSTHLTTAAVSIVDEAASTLDIILRAVYRIREWRQDPSTNALIEAVDCFEKYGLSPASYVSAVPITEGGATRFPSENRSPIFDALLSRAHDDALTIYALAGHYDLHDLAVAVSEHLLSLKMSDVDEDLALRMQTTYFMKLLMLHHERQKALKEIVEPPPAVHPPTPGSGSRKHDDIQLKWKMAVANLIWDADPIHGLSVSDLEGTLEAALEGEHCESCRENFVDRIRDVLVKWECVKTTID